MLKRIVWDYTVGNGIVEPTEFIVLADGTDIGHVPGSGRFLDHEFPNGPFSDTLIVRATDGTTNVDSDPFVFATALIGKPFNLHVEDVP